MKTETTSYVIKEQHHSMHCISFATLYVVLESELAVTYRLI